MTSSTVDEADDDPPEAVAQYRPLLKLLGDHPAHRALDALAKSGGRHDFTLGELCRIGDVETDEEYAELYDHLMKLKLVDMLREPSPGRFVFRAGSSPGRSFSELEETVVAEYHEDSFLSKIRSQV